MPFNAEYLYQNNPHMLAAWKQHLLSAQQPAFSYHATAIQHSTGITGKFKRKTPSNLNISKSDNGQHMKTKKSDAINRKKNLLARYMASKEEERKDGDVKRDETVTSTEGSSNQKPASTIDPPSLAGNSSGKTNLQIQRELISALIAVDPFPSNATLKQFHEQHKVHFQMSFGQLQQKVRRIRQRMQPMSTAVEEALEKTT